MMAILIPRLRFLVAIMICARSVDAKLGKRSTVQILENKIVRTTNQGTSYATVNFRDLIRGGAIESVDVDEEQYKISLSPLAFASIFAFLGGWTHALCNQKFDVYTAMVSGHFINMSVLLARKEWRQALWRISIIGSYFSGVVSGRVIELRCISNPNEVNGKEPYTSDNQHFKIIAALVVVLFSMAEKLPIFGIHMLTFGYGLIYPSVSAALGGTITHLLTGHTTNIARLVGANQTHHIGMKTSLCVLVSVLMGALFGTIAMGILGEEFPYFATLGFFYASMLILL